MNATEIKTTVTHARRAVEAMRRLNIGSTQLPNVTIDALIEAIETLQQERDTYAAFAETEAPRVNERVGQEVD